MLEAKAYLDPENFYITNPNLGRSVSREWLEAQLIKNQAKTDGTFQQFLAKHLNVEIGLNLRSDRWAGTDFWEAAAERVTLQELLERSEVVTVGIDGGGLDDLLGLTLCGRCESTGRWLTWSRAWAHEIVLERRKEIAPRLHDFARDGDLVLVKRIGDDVEELAAIVAEVEEHGLLDKVGIDPAGVGGVLEALAAAGVPEERSSASARAGSWAALSRPPSASWPRVSCGMAVSR